MFFFTSKPSATFLASSGSFLFIFASFWTRISVRADILSTIAPTFLAPPLDLLAPFNFCTDFLAAAALDLEISTDCFSKTSPTLLADLASITLERLPTPPPKAPDTPIVKALSIVDMPL